MPRHCVSGTPTRSHGRCTRNCSDRLATVAQPAIADSAQRPHGIGATSPACLAAGWVGPLCTAEHPLPTPHPYAAGDDRPDPRPGSNSDERTGPRLTAVSAPVEFHRRGSGCAIQVSSTQVPSGRHRQGRVATFVLVAALVSTALCVTLFALVIVDAVATRRRRSTEPALRVTKMPAERS
jgi:hypothetical protein